MMAYLQNKQLSDPHKCIKYSMTSDCTNVSCYIFKIENFLIENVKYGTNYVYWSIIFYIIKNKNKYRVRILWLIRTWVRINQRIRTH